MFKKLSFGVVIFFALFISAGNSQYLSYAERKSLKENIEKRWDSFVKTLLFDFEYTTCDFGSGSPDVNISLAPVTELPEDARKGHGTYVLRIDMNFKKTNHDQRLIQTHFMDEDWSDVLGVQFDVFLPFNGPDTLTVTPYMMCNQWKLWSQDEKRTPLVKGKWVTVKFVLPAQEKPDLKRLTTIGFFIWGTIPFDFKGPVYVDNFFLISEKPLKSTQELPAVKIEKTETVTVNIDASLTGGKISPYLLSINSGDSVRHILLEHLKKIGCGGFMRTWGWLGHIDNFNPKRGLYDWSYADSVIKTIKDAGFEPLVTLGLCPSWMATKDSSGKPKNNGPPTDPELWAEMAADIVKHYNKDLGYNIKYWEIWNEPDIFFWGGTEEEYNILCKKASIAMKKVDPSIKIIGGAWASSLAPTSSRLKTLLELEPDIDFISYHNYLLGSADFKEEELWNILPASCEAPIYKARKSIRAVAKQMNKPSYTNIDVMMTEACIQPDTKYDPRIETVLYPVYWMTALWHYVHQNLHTAVYFTLTGKVWGVLYNKPRPVFDLFFLLKDKAKFANANWLKTSDTPEDLKVLALRNVDCFSVVLINKSIKNVQYKVSFNIENLLGVDSFTIYRLDSKNNGEKSIGVIKNSKNSTVDCPPYSITVLRGDIKPGTVNPVLVKFEEEPSAAALGFQTSGQYSFTGEKAEFLKLDGKIKIDGDLKEFEKAKPIFVGKKEKISTGEPSLWTGPEDCSMTVRTLWDNKNLYFGIEITDDVPFVNNTSSGADMWNGDCVELFIGTKHVHLSRKTKGEYDYQILISPKGGKFRPKEGVIFFEPGPGMGTRNAEPKGSKISVKKTKKGCVIECMIPGENFLDFENFKEGDEFRFDIGFDDADKDKRDIQIMWNADKHDVWDNPDLWGVAVLKNK